MKHKFGESPVVSAKSIRQALDGETSSIVNGLYWRGSAQGADHWYSIFNGDKRLSKRSRQYLNKLLNDARR